MYAIYFKRKASGRGKAWLAAGSCCGFEGGCVPLFFYLLALLFLLRIYYFFLGVRIKE